MRWFMSITKESKAFSKLKSVLKFLFSKFLGEFSEGLFHGFGVYIRFDGMQYEGEFKEGTTHGPGLVTFPSGSSGKPRQEGFFEGSKLKSRQSVSQFVKRAQASRDRALTTTLNNIIKEQ